MMGMKNKKTRISQIFERSVSTAICTCNLVDTRKNRPLPHRPTGLASGCRNKSWKGFWTSSRQPFHNRAPSSRIRLDPNAIIHG